MDFEFNYTLPLHKTQIIVTVEIADDDILLGFTLPLDTEGGLARTCLELYARTEEIEDLAWEKFRERLGDNKGTDDRDPHEGGISA